jgi:hypothetical protein
MKESILELIQYKELNLADYSDVSDLHEALDYDGSLHELIDGNIEIYTHKLWAWAAENYEYVDQAINEGLASLTSGIVSCLQAGHFMQLSEEANEALEEIFNKFKEKQDEVENA